VPQIQLLVDRLLKTGHPVVLAIPEAEVIQYAFLLDVFKKNLVLFTGSEDDPMKRMCDAAYAIKADNIIRVTHDKIFVDTERLEPMLKEFTENDLDYTYSSDFVPGTGFEVISRRILEQCVDKFKRVEHISYAVRALSKNSLNYRFQKKYYDIRLLIDYPEDVSLMNVIIACLGTDCSLKDVLAFVDNNRQLKSINKLPMVTVYTCAFNAAKWIQDAMGSVAQQTNFKDCEYIIIDDHSSDRTILPVAKFCQTYKNSRFIRNDKNIGLASSSNVALKHARGKYIMRLDADDFFVNKHVIQNMVTEIETEGHDVVYPNCYAGLSMRTVQKGADNNHVGGALFRTSAINHIKFTDALRNYDSLDLFMRAKDQLKVGYWNRVAFCYRQHNESMSRNNLKDREKTKKMIEEKYGKKN
jgi:spore coat polysaccharide biosynthesis protein SpsF (cytidylyltransferase family)